ALSYAIEELERPGGTVAGFIFVQLVPSHSQVSFRYGPMPPPKSTVRPRRLSNAIAWYMRPDGARAGAFAVQVEPSHSQVSLSQGNPPPHGSPPNSTRRLRTLSYAMPW